MIRPALCALLIAACTATQAGTVISGRVVGVGVADGDTLTLLDSDLAFGRGAMAECSKVDRYKRKVCRITVDDADLCLEQLRAGLAWVFIRYAHELPAQRRADYADTEQTARTERRGLWRDVEPPMPPWEWRHR